VTKGAGPTTPAKKALTARPTEKGDQKMRRFIPEAAGNPAVHDLSKALPVLRRKGAGVQRSTTNLLTTKKEALTGTTAQSALIPPVVSG